MKRAISGILILSLLVTLTGIVPLQARAELSASCEKTISSTDFNQLGERYTISVDDDTDSILLTGTTRVSYAACQVNVYQVQYNALGKGVGKLVYSPVFAVMSNQFSIHIQMQSFAENGATYWICPNFAKTTASTVTGYQFSSFNTMTGALLQYQDSDFHILRYLEIEQQNKSVQQTADQVLPENYLDVTMRDSFDADYGLSLEDSQKLVQFANELVMKQGAYTENQKLIAFHDFITSNFYYDSTARKKQGDKILNPATLLTMYQETGKARTVCDGMAAFFQILARSQGIPCRTVRGHHLILPGHSWEFETDINTVNHVWNEAYVDADGDGSKEWITIDCNADCDNTYTKENGYQSPESPVKRYTYFNPSNQQLAVTHRCISYREEDGDYLRPQITQIGISGEGICLSWKIVYRDGNRELTTNQKENLAGYVIYRRVIRGKWKVLKKIETDSWQLSYQDQTARTGVKYQYRVSAIAKSDGSVGVASPRKTIRISNRRAF